MRRVMLLSLLALALPTAVLANSTDPITINFGVVVNPFTGGEASFGPVGSSLQNSTSFNFGGGPYVVSIVGPGDQSGLSRGDAVTLSPSLLSYGDGMSGPISLTKSWSSGLGNFSESFTEFTADRSSPNALTLDLLGTVSGPGGAAAPITLILNANQAGGPGRAVNWSLTEIATAVPVPEPSALDGFLLGTCLIGLTEIGRRKFNLGT